MAEFEEFSNEISSCLEMFLSDDTSELYNDLYNYIQERVLEAIPEMVNLDFKDKERNEPDYIFPVQFVVPCDNQELLERLSQLERNKLVVQKIGQVIFNWITVRFQPEENSQDNFEYDLLPSYVKVVADPQRKYFAVTFNFEINLNLGLMQDVDEDEENDPKNTS